MAGSILDMARSDTSFILKSGGFETTLTLSKIGETDKVINGLAIKRTDRLTYDDGSNKNEPYSHISVLITDLPSAMIGVTDQIVVTGWSVTFTDAQSEKTYNLREALPNRTLGYVSFVLQNA